MKWLWAAITGAFSGLAQGLLSLFGMSDAQKLGRAEVENKDLTADLKEKTDEAKLMEKPDRSYATLIGLFRKRAE